MCVCDGDRCKVHVHCTGRGGEREMMKRERDVYRQRDIVHMQGHVYTNGDCKTDNVKRKIP